MSTPHSNPLIVEGQRKCTKCKDWKPIDLFYRDERYRAGRKRQCIDCESAAANDRRRRRTVREPDVVRRRKKDGQLRSQFGITLDEFEAMVFLQDNLCMKCGEPETSTDDRTGEVRALCVDHCHDTGRVRGLLCARCNAGIGALGDSIEGLLEAIRYLESAPTKMPRLH